MSSAEEEQMKESTLRSLIRPVEESQIESPEIRRLFRTIRITKRLAGNHNGSSSAPSPRLVDIAVPSPAPPPVVASPTPAAASVTEPSVPPSSLVEIKAPMVGTFYRAPTPGAPSFVDVGKKVAPGDVLCIIEAMKLMNEIEAEQGGQITKILVEDGQPIEFGQLLFLLDPTA
jgi:acetyl-CoA carboxylase biotin carboxyl carrier protein